ncbi:MAG: SpoIIE family protein phosphatase [Candidatus Krumholzibacteria bacterium]|nr:SpoIIE family protein phosphatase [Candidatus Krumholzibacteria bacterium]
MAKKRLFGQLSNAFSSKGEGVGDADRASNAETLENLRRENLRLTRALEELSMLNELAREIGASRNADAIMDRIIRRSLRSVYAEQAVITLVSEQAREPMKTLVRAMVTSSEHEQFHLNQNLLGWMHLNKRPLLSNSPRADERFRGITWDPSIHSILCVPLMVKSELIGVLTAYNKKSERDFTEEDQRLLTIIAMQSAQVIENARLYEEEQAYLRMQEEVRLAAVIQLELLPKEAPRVPEYDIAGRSIPAQKVGGDYFDFIPVEGDRLAICLGDVSGKGLPASLLMANLQATLRSQTLLDAPPCESIRRSNQLLYRSTDPEKFATLFYGILDFGKHELTFSNAGHENPFLFGPHSPPTRLETGGTVLGVIENFPFEEEVVRVQPGDTLVVFSDGITDAFDPEDNQFGEQRLVEILTQHQKQSAEDIIDRIIDAVKKHAGTAPQTDDLTLLVLKRHEA